MARQKHGETIPADLEILRAAMREYNRMLGAMIRGCADAVRDGHASFALGRGEGRSDLFAPVIATFAEISRLGAQLQQQGEDLLSEPGGEDAGGASGRGRAPAAGGKDPEPAP